MRRFTAFLLALAAALPGAGPAKAQVARTWVGPVGDDANACNRPDIPCKSFQGALAKTSPGGEISVVSPGGYGPVIINKSVTINGLWGGEAGVLVGQGINGVSITIAPTDVVVLRGLYIKGMATAATGVRV